MHFQLIAILSLAIYGAHAGLTGAQCPKAKTRVVTSAPSCSGPTDPNNKPKSGLESWFTPFHFTDMFPKANLGYGPHKCLPYSYESFVIAARYFPKFGAEQGRGGYSLDQNRRRDVAAFFAQTIQETGENDATIYNGRSVADGNDCYFRGGLYHWFEYNALVGGNTGKLSDGSKCNGNYRYCQPGQYPCSSNQNACYFGRGPFQLSWNYNYGAFQNWLKTQKINVDLINNPNLLFTSTNPPLIFMASLWFYMTPQAPKPSMHDVVIGNWNPNAQNVAAGYGGAVFGPTNRIINGECGGELAGQTEGFENRRIKAFRWFCLRLGVSPGPDRTLTCKYMTSAGY